MLLWSKHWIVDCSFERCGWGWLWNPNPPASASHVLGLELCCHTWRCCWGRPQPSHTEGEGPFIEMSVREIASTVSNYYTLVVSCYTDSQLGLLFQAQGAQEQTAPQTMGMSRWPCRRGTWYIWEAWPSWPLWGHGHQGGDDWPESHTHNHQGKISATQWPRMFCTRSPSLALSSRPSSSLGTTGSRCCCAMPSTWASRVLSGLWTARTSTMPAAHHTPTFSSSLC